MATTRATEPARRRNRLLGVLGTTLLASSLALSSTAAAGTSRVAVLIANHDGGESLPKLRYADRDARRMEEVLKELGGFSGADILRVVDEDAADVIAALEDAERRVAALKERGEQVIYVVYYSGHAQNGVLHLGESRLEMARVKQHLDESTADVRLGFVDSCGAGAITREKGASLAPPFVVAVDHSLTAKGQVIIASSSADEASQESDEIQGSFFTHYLTTGLRGAADGDGDGKVTLEEAYRYAYKRTVAATATTRSGAQHPTYAYDLKGAGDVVLTQPGGADVVITFPEDLEGQYYVVDADRQLFVAEIEKPAGEASRISLPTGRYVIKKRLDTHLLMQRLSAREKGVFVVDEARMERVSFENDYAKGSPIAVAIDGEVVWSLSVGGGGQWVFDDPDAGALFPPIAFVVLEGRARNLLGRHLVSSLDLTFGSRESQISVEKDAFDIQYTQLQLGSSLLYELSLGDFSLAAGPRLALFGVRAAYLGDDAGLAQHFFTFTPGLVGVAGWNVTSWFHVEAMVRGNYVIYNLGETRSLGYVEGLLSAWLDF